NVHARNNAHLADDIRRTVGGFGYSYVLSVEPLNARIDRSLLPERTLSMLSGIVAAFTAVLGALGLYALLTYMLERRLREMALRLALGASGRALMMIIVKDGLVVALLGIVVGGPVAWFVGRAAHAMLPGLPSSMIPAFTAALALVAIALLAIAGPARRAARTDPAVALRLE
ncbi:MAG TPA: FtsX-like permease family protein, partial [Vicinamibacterales bacterium]